MQVPLPARPGRVLNPARRAVIAQFLRFGVVGGIGFVVDTATVYGLRSMLGLYGAGIAAYLVAVVGNWTLNRIWTFRGASKGAAHRQLALYFVTNLGGFVLNRGTYALLVTYLAAAANQPVIATAAGTGAGMFVNFYLSRRVVFR